MRPHRPQHRCHMMEFARRRACDFGGQIGMDDGPEVCLEFTDAPAYPRSRVQPSANTAAMPSSATAMPAIRLELNAATASE